MVLDVITDASEDVFVGQTLKRPFMPNLPIEEQTHIGKGELSYELKFDSDNDGFQEFVRQDIVDQSIFSLSFTFMKGLMFFTSFIWMIF